MHISAIFKLITFKFSLVLAACIVNMFGEWRGETAADLTKNKMKNPKFILTIPGTCRL